MVPLKKNNPKRKWRSFKRHALLLFEATSASVTATTIWYQCWVRGWYFSEDDKEIVVGVIIAMILAMFTVLMSWIFPSTWEKYQSFVLIAFTKDKDLFMRLRDERMPIAFHLLIGGVSVPPIVMIAFVPYKHMITGMATMLLTSFMIIMLWLVLNLIEHPLKSEWIRERIDDAWMTEDVDEYWKRRNAGKETIR
jgi:hypothetical protein